MKIDWKEFLFVGVPSALAAGGMIWYTRKRGANVVTQAFAGAGAGSLTFYAVHFIRARLKGAPDQLPDATMGVLPSAQVPVATPTADAAMGKVAEREKAVATPNTKPTNPQEVGDNVVDIQGMNLDAFGSTGSI